MLNWLWRLLWRPKVHIYIRPRDAAYDQRFQDAVHRASNRHVTQASDHMAAAKRWADLYPPRPGVEL